MEEIVLRWIERVGFPIFIACVSLYAVYSLFKMFLSKSNVLQETLTNHAATVTTLTANTNKALGANTLATQELSETIKKKLDGGICHASPCKAVTVEKFEELLQVNKEIWQQGKAAKEATQQVARDLRDKAVVIAVTESPNEQNTHNKD